MATDYSKYIWNFLIGKIKNEYGVAGLMGNLEAESGLIPYRVQGDTPVSSFSVNYTNKVDNGTISKNTFIYDTTGGGGYGLAQWTYYMRKKGLYEKHISLGKSIGNIDVALEWLWEELNKDYVSVLNVLLTCTDILSASNKVLFDYESPADQSLNVQEYRNGLCVKWYNTYSGSTYDETMDKPQDEYPTEPPLPTEDEKDSLYNILVKKGYNMKIIPSKNYPVLKKLEIGDSCTVDFTFNRNKRIFGTNCYGGKMKIDCGIDYTIVAVLNNGSVAIRYKNGLLKYIKPKYIKGV